MEILKNKKWWNKLSEIIGIDKKTKNVYDIGRELSNELDCKVLENGYCDGSDGIDYYSKVLVTCKRTGESLPFNCRNIFDYGFAINPEYNLVEGGKIGGLSDSDRKKWLTYETDKGWIEVRPITEFEKKCLDYLQWKFYSFSEIRM